MNFFQAVFLGLVQALTEFLPVSSSAHLSFFGQLFDQGYAGDASPGFTAFTAIIQIGTEVAIILYFLKDIVRILKAWFTTFKTAVISGPKRETAQKIGLDATIGWMIVLGTIPIILSGVLLKNFVETTFRSLWITATMLIFVGILMLFADIRGKQQLNLTELNTKRTLCYGLAQCFALIPGVSRSGATISAGRALGFNRETAARFSFYLSIPSIFGASIFELKSALGDTGSLGFPGWGATITATIVSFVGGYIVVAVFMKAISHISLKGFVIYRIAFGGLIIALLSAGILV
ncbi:MAG: UDP-diphosphatase [Candidatus Ancillula sp.]|nr:UDP-diphosphatase [Candidatus Ancillula sp.]